MFRTKQTWSKLATQQKARNHRNGEERQFALDTERILVSQQRINNNWTVAYLRFAYVLPPTQSQRLYLQQKENLHRLDSCSLYRGC